MLNEVWFRPAPIVLELGSGASTVVLARLLRELGGGALVAVEHDMRWADRIRHQLAHERLDAASVVFAPMGPHRDGWDDAEWYAEAVLTAALPDRPLDVLVVDGPPAWQPGTEHARYPALPVLAGRLAPGAAVVLDDVERAGEQAVLERWRAEHDLVFRAGSRSRYRRRYVAGELSVDVVRVIGVLEEGGGQLSALRLSQGLRRNGMRTVRLLAGDATPGGGVALARRYGIDVETYVDPGSGRRLGLQWCALPGFLEWLEPRLPSSTRRRRCWPVSTTR